MTQPIFSFDIASPDAYLAAERLAGRADFEPVLAARLPAGEVGAFRCAEEHEVHRGQIERRAAAQSLQPLRWPPWPFDSGPAMLAATYARGIGKGVAFSLAAFRQAYAGGTDLSDPDGVIVAAAACEIHPRAVLRALESRAVERALEESTEAAAAAGVRGVPALRFYGQVLHDDEIAGWAA